MNQQTPQASTQIRLALQFSADQSILRKGQGPSILRQKVATFRRKIGVFGMMASDGRKASPAGSGRRGLLIDRVAGAYGAFCFFLVRPMLMMLSAIMPSPTQRLIPSSPLYRQRLSPCRRLVTLMRPSQPVRHL